MRNLLAEKQVLLDVNGEEIRWDYLVKLEQLQAQQGLRAGNKLTARHISWTKQKVKVNLAAQTLSSSVGDALEFCHTDLGLQEFENCAATVRYIRIVDRAFDLLNSRNPLAKGYKAPLRTSNEGLWRPFINTAKSYLWELRLSTGARVCESNRKTGVVGLVTSLTSFSCLFASLVAANSALSSISSWAINLAKTTSSYFSCAVRARGGWNNNPTARQYKAAYKRLLLHQNVKNVVPGNCFPQESFEVLTVSSHTEKQDRLVVVETDCAVSVYPN